MNNYVFFVESKRNLLLQEVVNFLEEVSADIYDLDKALKKGQKSWYSFLLWIIKQNKIPVIVHSHPATINFHYPQDCVLVTHNILQTLSKLLDKPLTYRQRRIDIYTQKGLWVLLENERNINAVLSVLCEDYENKDYVIDFDKLIASFERHGCFFVIHNNTFIPEVAWHILQIKSYTLKQDYALLMIDPPKSGQIKISYFGKAPVCSKIDILPNARAIERRKNIWCGFFPQDDQKKIEDMIFSMH